MDLPTFPMLDRDWSRIRRRVSDLANPISWARDLAWSCVSLGAGCLLVLVPWLPAYEALGRDAQLSFDWVTPSLLISAGACFVIAVISFVQHSRVEKVIRRDVTHVIDEMDEIFKASPTDPGQPPGTSPAQADRRLRELRDLQLERAREIVARYKKQQ